MDAFTRLNVGKIPLTNDELIRALFLRRERGAKEGDDFQQRIAHEWDQLEKALQADGFWYFLNNEIAPNQNRIEFLFSLVAKAEGLPPGAEHDTYGVFYAYNQRMKEQGASPKEEWRKLKRHS